MRAADSRVRLSRRGTARGRGHVLIASAFLVALIAAGCNDEGRADLMPVRNYSNTEVTVVHLDDGGGEMILQDASGSSVVGPNGAGLMLEIHDTGWCAHGAFIARTTAGVEVARRTASRTTSICGTWTIGSPPPSPSQ